MAQLVFLGKLFYVAKNLFRCEVGQWIFDPEVMRMKPIKCSRTNIPRRHIVLQADFLNMSSLRTAVIFGNTRNRMSQWEKITGLTNVYTLSFLPAVSRPLSPS